jgi:aryl-alcohol dehydrogenase-like predicted oxidoreductase
MDRQFCVGLLGVSGNYGKVNYSQLVEYLSFALQNYSLVDLSSDYGIEFNLVNTLRKLQFEEIKAKYIYKVGCEYLEAYNVSELINRTVADLEFLNKNKVESLLLHRPSALKLPSDINFYRFMKSNYPEIPFGICTNSKQLYYLYKSNMNIKVVQVAVNPLDYASTVDFLNLLAKDGVVVQARSILSSGLLSGKYCRKTNFNDPMRLRYNTQRLRSKYFKRIDTALEVIKYINCEYEISVEEVPAFLYSVFEKMPNITHVIRGGSSLSQISNNLASISIDNASLTQFISKMKFDWGCEYV